jgi:hypothetical protein
MPWSIKAREQQVGFGLIDVEHEDSETSCTMLQRP